MTEVRKAPRQLTLKTAKIVAEHTSSLVDCAILNVSDRGACILVPRFAEIPNAFRLIVDPDGKIYDCSVPWKW